MKAVEASLDNSCHFRPLPYMSKLLTGEDGNVNARQMSAGRFIALLLQLGW